MRPVQIAATESSSVNGGGASDLSAAALFEIVWDTLAETLGTATVAAIVRRAARRAAANSPELVDLTIVREDLEYRYVLPQAWSHNAQRAPSAFRELVVEIGLLLVELTGAIVIRRLEQIPELRASHLVWRPEEAN